MHLVSPSLKKKLHLIDHVLSISINDCDFARVVRYLGGRLKIILDPNEETSMFDAQSFMLDTHLDVVCTVKGLRSNDGDREAMDF